MRRDVFQAIADPTRRQIIRLITTKPIAVNEVAEQFQVSRQAISKHVKILTDCGLITIKEQGRERLCEAKLDALAEVSAWVEQYRKFFEVKLDALESYLETLQQKNKKHGKQRTKTKRDRRS